MDPAEAVSGVTGEGSAIRIAGWSADVEANPHRDLRAFGAALVTVRFVVEMRAPGIDREADNEIRCVNMDARGLVVCSHTELGGYLEVLARLMGRPSGPISATPKAIEVFFDGQTDGHGATLIARDSDRDLAWLQIDAPPSSTLPWIDPGLRAEAGAGEALYYVRRLDPFFGSAVVVSEGVVGAVIDRPRRLLVPSRPGDGRLGMPVFTAEGLLLGLVVAQVPGDEDAAAVAGARSRSLPGQAGRSDDMVGGVILPARDLAKATALALETWAADREERSE